MPYIVLITNYVANALVLQKISDNRRIANIKLNIILVIPSPGVRIEPTSSGALVYEIRLLPNKPS